MTFDPEIQGLGLPQYPPLPANTEHVHLEEIRRTLVFSNLDVGVCTWTNLIEMDFFLYMNTVIIYKLDSICWYGFLLVSTTDEFALFVGAFLQ